MSSLALITAPAVEPVLLNDVLIEMGYGSSDSLDPATLAVLGGRINPKILAARTDSEGYTRRAFITQTWELSLDGFPTELISGREILLPNPPLQSITQITYTDTQGVVQTMTPDQYQLDLGGDTQPGRLLPTFAQPWPVTRRCINSVQIQFVCGYGVDASKVPAPILSGISFFAQFLFEQGGAAADAPMPRIVRTLLDPYRNLIS